MDQYANFDLVIDREGDGYVARVIDSPAGEASHAFGYPFSRLELENFLLRVGHARKTVRRIDSPQTEAAREFGGKLYESVFGGEVKTCFRRALDEADRQDPPQGLRVRIRFDNALDMADLPWEFLYSKSLDEFLVHSTRTPLVRYIDLPDRTRPLEVEPPLRILVMVSSPTDVVELDVDKEYDRLAKELDDLVKKGVVDIERLDDANLSALQKKLRQYKPHIFHYIGHGGYDEARDDGVLMLEDERGRGQAVSGHELGTILRDHRSLRLAFLNSCEGARNSTTDPFAGTAQSLIRKGIPAVVAMQFEITDEAAVVFAHEFYAAIADGYAVDAASAEARKVMLGQPGVEWATPVLTMRAPDGLIFKVTGDPVPPKPKPEIPPETATEPSQELSEKPTPNGAAESRSAASAPSSGEAPSTTPEPSPTGLIPGPTPSPAPSSTPKAVPEAAAASAQVAPIVSQTATQPKAPPPAGKQPPRKATKKSVPTFAWVIMAILGTLVAITILILAIPWEDDVPPLDTQANNFVDPTAAAEDPASNLVFRPGEQVFAERITGFDANGLPAWGPNPASVVFTPNPVFSDGWDQVVDQTTDWIFGWDEQFLYAQVFVNDDVYFQDQVGNQLFRGDSLNLDIDTDLEGDADTTAPNSDDFQLIMTMVSLNSPTPQSWLFQGNGSIFVDAPNQGGTGIVFLEVPSEGAGSYDAEIRIPWSDLGVTPEPGMRMGFRVSANDNDVFEARQEVMYSNVPDSILRDVTSWGTLVLE